MFHDRCVRHHHAGETVKHWIVIFKYGLQEQTQGYVEPTFNIRKQQLISVTPDVHKREIINLVVKYENTIVKYYSKILQ